MRTCKEPPIPGEIWKRVVVDKAFIQDSRVEVSNFGRVRTFNKMSDGAILKFSYVHGYPLIRRKHIYPRDPKVQERFDKMQNQIFKLQRLLKQQKLADEKKVKIKETAALLKTMKENLHKSISEESKSRAVSVCWLVHRLVAQYFLPKPKKDQVRVAHLDFEKTNNRADNLKWMTLEENFIHQSKSPYVIAEQKTRLTTPQRLLSVSKLTVPKVMLIKKLFNTGKTKRDLARQFGVSETQIKRIVRGENWTAVKAAK